MADGESGYKVGPGRPPLHTRFKKGQSGNPGKRNRLPSAAGEPGPDRAPLPQDAPSPDKSVIIAPRRG